MKSKIKSTLVIILLAVSLAFILWFTIFSRLGSETRQFFLPFTSYKMVLEGSRKALWEIIGNVALFIPVGVIAVLIFHMNIPQAILMGFLCSLCIESCQWVFWLGTFEVDDLLHNTLGALIGAALVRGTKLGLWLKISEKVRVLNVIALIALAGLMLAGRLYYREMLLERMVEYAAMNDKEDAKNLLVLNLEPNYIGETDFTAAYNSDGTLTFEGYNENKAWIEISTLTLPEGSYYFSGLTDVPDEIAALELEYFDEEEDNFIWLTQDVGSTDGVIFELEKPTKLRVLIRLFADAKGSYTARPVIYKED